MNDLTVRDGVLIGVAIASVIWCIILLAVILGGTKYCPECGRKYINDVSYCKYDGTELKEAR